MIPLWAIRLAPYAGGVLLAVGAYFWAHERGVQEERATWQAARAELLQLRTERGQWEADKLAKKSDHIPKIGVKETVRVETHWRDRPVRDCFDVDLVRSLEEARATVRQSAAASTSSD